MVPSSPRSFAVSTISAMPAGAKASTRVGTGSASARPTPAAMSAMTVAPTTTTPLDAIMRGTRRGGDARAERAAELDAERRADENLRRDEDEVGHAPLRQADEPEHDADRDGAHEPGIGKGERCKRGAAQRRGGEQRTGDGPAHGNAGRDRRG